MANMTSRRDFIKQAVFTVGALCVPISLLQTKTTTIITGVGGSMFDIGSDVVLLGFDMSRGDAETVYRVAKFENGVMTLQG